MTMADVDRLIAKLDELSSKMEQCLTKLAVLESQRSSGERITIDHELRIRNLERARMWLHGAAAGAGAVLAFVLQYVAETLGLRK